jgi:hypothetical protein
VAHNALVWQGAKELREDGEDVKAHGGSEKSEDGKRWIRAKLGVRLQNQPQIAV